MKTLSTFILSAFFAFQLSAQKPEAEILIASTDPVIGGEIDEVWSEANVYDIKTLELTNTAPPSLGLPGETSWQGLWSEKAGGIFLLVTVNDDDYYPWYEDPAANIDVSWQYDKIEIYFDVNFELEDGLGAAGGNGHYQFAPPFEDEKVDGTQLIQGNVQYAFTLSGDSYVAEFFIPFAGLQDKDGIEIDLMANIGLGISIIDRDAGGDPNRATWANDASIGSSWNNMDGCGIINFDGVTAPIFVDEITLQGGAITENNGQLQMVVEVLPVDATNQRLAWSVENGSGRASIDENGILTGQVDGEVTVTATAKDGSYTEASMVIEVSNQVVSIGELNIIRNWNFDQVNADGTPTSWSFAGIGDPAQVIDGIANCYPALSDDGNPWNSKLSQIGEFHAIPNSDYIFSFVAWADSERQIAVDFEDPNNAWVRYGSTTHEYSPDGRSQWNFDLTATATKYVFDINFDQIQANTSEELHFMGSWSDVPYYVDSVLLILADDFDLITEYTPVSNITVSSEGDATTIKQGSVLQMSAAILPVDADYSASVNWSVVTGTGHASIDENGLLTGDSVGTVSVVASAKDDSGIQGFLDVSVSDVTEIEKNDIYSLTLYPNPALNEINVTLDAPSSDLSIYSIAGVKMYDALVNGGSHTVDISSYPSGLYLLKTNNSVKTFIKE